VAAIEFPQMNIAQMLNRITGAGLCAGVAGLFVYGIFLLVVMIVLKRKYI
jgi:hypothetical protein